MYVFIHLSHAPPCVGPSSLARIQIEPEGGAGGCLKVCYQPLEVGVFSVNLQFNGVEVEGCPFHPKIVDPSAVQVIDDPCDWTGPDRFMVQLNELRSIHFDTSGAGPGLSRVNRNSLNIHALQFISYYYCCNFDIIVRCIA